MKRILALPIPSTAVISRTMSIIADIVGPCIVEIMKELYGTKGKIITVNDKVIKSTEKMSNYNKPIHIMTAYLTKSGISLG